VKKEKSCGAVIFNDKNQVLIIKHNKGHWSFPKGHVEGNETEVVTALREVKEETNLDVIIDDSIRVVITYLVSEDIEKDVVYFKGINPKGEIKLQEEEVCDYKWLCYEEATKEITYDDDKKVLKSIYTR
jgi:8-oxo-dGTP pyrophosphatase MutT (NUDIX family)